MIQQVFENRSQFQFPDSGPYFFDRLNDMVQSDYIPTVQDIVRTRIRTTGIVENIFKIGQNECLLIDVGGQRTERKKWIHCFQDVTSVIFVTAIQEYDQVLFEDQKTNRMIESLNLFEDTINNQWFEKMPIILFLNKSDLLQAKIEKVPLSTCFPDFQGPENDFGAACSYIQEQFELRNKNDQRVIYPHITCATDTDNVTHVFNAVADIVLKLSLENAGLT